MKKWQMVVLGVAALAMLGMVFMISQSDPTHATAVVPAGKYAGQVPKEGTEGMDPRHRR